MLFPVSTPWMEPLQELLACTDLLLLDEDEACQIALEKDLSRAIKILQAQGPKITVVKRGAQGSWLSQGGKLNQAPGCQGTR